MYSNQIVHKLIILIFVGMGHHSVLRALDY